MSLVVAALFSGFAIGLSVALISAAVYRRLRPPTPPLPEEVRLFATALTLKNVSVLEGLSATNARVMEKIVEDARKRLLQLHLNTGDSLDYTVNVDIK